MYNNEFIGLWGGLSTEEIGIVLRGVLQKQARNVFLDVLSAEVDELCGSAYRPTEGQEYRRAGSEKGYFFDGERRYEIKRPRVRQRKENGSEKEQVLETYEAGKQAGGIEKALLNAFRAGVSSRDQKNLQNGTRGTSSSAASRLWIQEGNKALEAFHSRDIGSQKWLVLMLDGIALGDDLTRNAIFDHT